MGTGVAVAVSRDEQRSGSSEIPYQLGQCLQTPMAEPVAPVAPMRWLPAHQPCRCPFSDQHLRLHLHLYQSNLPPKRKWRTLTTTMKIMQVSQSVRSDIVHVTAAAKQHNHHFHGAVCTDILSFDDHLASALIFTLPPPCLRPRSNASIRPTIILLSLSLLSLSSRSHSPHLSPPLLSFSSL